MSASAQCPHMQFQAAVNVARIEDTGMKVAEIQIRCSHCGMPAQFRGVPLGVSPDHPTASIDGEEVRLPFLCEGDVYTGKGISLSVQFIGGDS